MTRRQQKRDENARQYTDYQLPDTLPHNPKQSTQSPMKIRPIWNFSFGAEGYRQAARTPSSRSLAENVMEIPTSESNTGADE